MITNPSDKILHFNTDLIYRKNKYTWKTSSHQRGRTPARNIINIRPGTAAKEASTNQQCFNLFITNKMINIIVLHTNEEIGSNRNSYKIMKSTISETCMEEIKALFGVFIKIAALKEVPKLESADPWGP